MGNTSFDIIENTGGLRRKEGTSYQTVLMDADGALYPDMILETFDHRPTFFAGTVNYGDPTGTTGDTNVMHTLLNSFEYHIKGTQTILAPVFSASGLNIAMDQTDNDGVELTNGITARSRAAYTIGTDNCYFEITATITDVSGTDDFCVGFRKQAAYQANVDDYTDAAYFQWAGTALNIETILNNAATTTVATTNTLTDATEFTMRVEIINGVTAFYLNGAAPSTQVNFTFDTGDVVMPFLFMLNSSDLCDSIYLTKWECGKLYTRG